jgi:antitoxin (DNA-binding transcriptional repressor) of toxin-antitoxin stability system
MTHVVSISDFRQDMSYYLALVSHGDTVILKDTKKDLEMARMVAGQRWDPIAYRKMLKRLASKPIFSAKDHPEWATLKKVDQWLRKTRMNSNRNFDQWISQ